MNQATPNRGTLISVRCIDKTGRLVLPMEVRKALNLTPGTPMKIYWSEKTVSVEKIETLCVYCNGKDRLFDFKGQKICRECLSELKTLNMV